MSVERRTAAETADDHAHADSETVEQPPFDPPADEWWRARFRRIAIR